MYADNMPPLCSLPRTEYGSLPTPPSYKSGKDATLLINGFIRQICNINIDIPNDVIDFCKPWFIHQITYNKTLDLLLNHDCCIGVYDFRVKQWRSAVYMDHWENTKRIMIRYSGTNAEYIVLKDFPINYIIYDSKMFNVGASDLFCWSNVPAEKFNLFKHRFPNRK